jgi:hypothetical protein
MVPCLFIRGTQNNCSVFWHMGEVLAGISSEKLPVKTREWMGVEPTAERTRDLPPILKTGRFTGTDTLPH